MIINNEHIKRGFWFYNQENPWEPKSTYFPKDYKDNELLNIACTQNVAVETSYEQNKLVKEWCEFLPKLENVKFLWFTTQVNQKLFDSVCEMQNLEGLFIKWSNIKDISNISKLKHLKHLYIGSSTQIVDSSHLKNLNNLVSLDLECIKSLVDINNICELKKLELLSITGDWNKHQTINSLKPIEKLQNLKSLSIIGTKVLDNSLKPISEIKSLINLNTALWFKKSEFEYLHTNLPNLKYGNILKIVNDPDFCKDMRIK